LSDGTAYVQDSSWKQSASTPFAAHNARYRCFLKMEFQSVSWTQVATKETPLLIIYRYPEWGQSKNRLLWVDACSIVAAELYDTLPTLSRLIESVI